jgi:hypothetical protein
MVLGGGALRLGARGGLLEHLTGRKRLPVAMPD